MPVLLVLMNELESLAVLKVVFQVATREPLL
jgi:hypothetical protein